MGAEEQVDTARAAVPATRNPISDALSTTIGAVAATVTAGGTRGRIARSTYGRWEARALLGEGGFAETFLAVDAHGQRAVIKELLRSGQEWVDRFEREAATYRDLGGIWTPLCYEAHLDPAEPGHRPWMALEYVDGATVGTLVHAHGRVEGDDLVVLARDLLDAVRFLGEREVAHRDLSPGNVMVERTGRLRLIDLGLARRTGATSFTGDQLPYTPGYAAPEVLAAAEERDGVHVGLAADLWSWAALVVLLASGRAPYAVEPVAWRAEMVGRQLPKLDRVPAALADAVRLAFAWDPGDRRLDDIDAALPLRPADRALAEARAEAARLQAQVEELRAERTKLRTEQSRLRALREDLTGEVEDLRAQLAAQESAVADLRAQVDRLSQPRAEADTPSAAPAKAAANPTRSRTVPSPVVLPEPETCPVRSRVDGRTLHCALDAGHDGPHYHLEGGYYRWWNEDGTPAGPRLLRPASSLERPRAEPARPAAAPQPVARSAPSVRPAADGAEDAESSDLPPPCGATGRIGPQTVECARARGHDGPHKARRTAGGWIAFKSDDQIVPVAQPPVWQRLAFLVVAGLAGAGWVLPLLASARPGWWLAIAIPVFVLVWGFGATMAKYCLFDDDDRDLTVTGVFALMMALPAGLSYLIF